MMRLDFDYVFSILIYSFIHFWNAESGKLGHGAAKSLLLRSHFDCFVLKQTEF